jgi:hypothetical protein
MGGMGRYTVIIRLQKTWHTAKLPLESPPELVRIGESYRRNVPNGLSPQLL